MKVPMASQPDSIRLQAIGLFTSSEQKGHFRPILAGGFKTVVASLDGPISCGLLSVLVKFPDSVVR
jgi:hypothetical protein